MGADGSVQGSTSREDERRRHELRRFMAGDEVVVHDARGMWLEKLAASDVKSGHKFPVVYLAWRDEPDAEPMAWPWDSVKWPDEVEGALSHDEYRAQFLGGS